MTIHNLDFHEEKLFPTFNQLPYDNDYDVNFYKDGRDGVLRPRRHWCFLVEITEYVPWLRPMYYAKDTDGATVFIAFHTDDRSPGILQECKVGDTLAIMYANSHAFMDGKVGIRVEADEFVKLFHCGLSSVVRIGEALNSESASCRACGDPATSRCAKCTMRYCSKKCQVADWKPRHKQECTVGKCVMQWKSFDWWKFDRFRTP